MNEIRNNYPQRENDIRELLLLVRRVEADPNTRIRSAERLRIRELLDKLYKDISL